MKPNVPDVDNTISLLNSLSVEDRQIVALLAKVCDDTEEQTLVGAVADMRRRTPDLLRLFGTLLGLTVGASVGMQERQLVSQVVRQVFELVTKRDASILQAQMSAVTAHIEQVVSGVRSSIANQSHSAIEPLMGHNYHEPEWHGRSSQDRGRHSPDSRHGSNRRSDRPSRR